MIRDAGHSFILPMSCLVVGVTISSKKLHKNYSSSKSAVLNAALFRKWLLFPFTHALSIMKALAGAIYAEPCLVATISSTIGDIHYIFDQVCGIIIQ